MICKHCGGEVREVKLGSHFTAIHKGDACQYDRLGEDDVICSPVCSECGGDYIISKGGISNHVDADGGIDYDKDANHVAFGDHEDEDCGIFTDYTGPNPGESPEEYAAYKKGGVDVPEGH